MATEAALGVDLLVDQAIERLRTAGKRMTTSRRVLLHCLFEGHGHRSAEALAESVRALAPDIHLSTVYRNLEEFERAGVVEHVHLGHGPATYHLSGERHGHLVCGECGATIEVPDALFASLEHDARERYGFSIDPHHFAMIGRCTNCAGVVVGHGA